MRRELGWALWCATLLTTSLGVFGLLWRVRPISELVAEPQSVRAEVAPVPVLVSTTDGISDVQKMRSSITAKAVYVVDWDSATPLLTWDDAVSLPPASTTKLMTTLLATKAYAMTEQVTVTDEESVDGNKARFKRGEVFDVSSLVQASIVFSGNDAAQALANHYAGGLPAFVMSMNELARQLGLSQTTFVNPTGIDNPAHRSTARDLALLAKSAFSSKEILAAAELPVVSIKEATGKRSVVLWNTNNLLGKEGVIAGKTGTTEQAGEVLISLAEHDGHKIIVVVLGSQDRYADTKQVLAYIWNSYTWNEIPTSHN